MTEHIVTDNSAVIAALHERIAALESVASIALTAYHDDDGDMFCETRAALGEALRSAGYLAREGGEQCRHDG